MSALGKIGTVDPQVALVLLRNCASFCKLVSLIRATPPCFINTTLQSNDATIRHSFAECTGVDTMDIAWKQAQLSLRMGIYCFIMECACEALN